MTRHTGHHQMKASPADPEAWGKEMAAVKARVEKKYGEGRFRPNVNDARMLFWTYEVRD